MPDLGTMSVGLGLDTGGLESGLGKAAGLLKNFGVASVAAVGVAVVGLGVAATHMAGDFQASMTSLVTGAGESVSNLKTVSDGILQMAVDTGTSAKQLADGMYMIESANHHGADALNILKAAAEGAKVGVADLGTVADATTTILKDYPNVLNGASGAVNTLISTTSQGKTHMEDLASSLSQILPTASAAKIGLNDVMGAMSTMTGEGVPAANAATYLRQTILALVAPSSKAQDALKSVGLTTDEVAKEMQKSLPDALAMITEAVGKKFPEGSAQYVAAIKDISGGSKTMQGMLDLTGDHLKDFQANVASITDTVKTAGDSIKGWALVQQNFNMTLDKAKEVAETLGIKLGTVLLPALGAVIKDVSNDILPLFNDLTTAFDKASKTITTVVKPLLDLKDAFDEGAAATNRLYNTVVLIGKPFDELGRGMNSVYHAAKSVAPSMDEGSRAAQRFADQAKLAKTPLDNIATVIVKDIIPAGKGLVSWFEKDLMPAANNAASLFDKDVLPSVESFAGFVAKNVIPTVGQLAEWIMTKVVPAAIQFAGWFDRQVVPILETVWTVLQKDVIPQVETFGDTIFNKVLPPVESLIGKLSPVLIPILNAVGWVLGNVVGPALNTTIGFIGDLLNIVDTVITAIGNFLGLLGQIKDGAGNAIGQIGNIGHALHIPGFASGTPYAPGGLALVGENGPEYVDLPRGSRVYPTGSAPSGMSGSGGGNHYHVHVTNQAPTVRQVMNGFRQMELLYG